MQAYRCVGFKSWLVRWLFVILSCVFLMSVNFFLFSFSFWRLLLLVFCWLWRWSLMRVLTRIYYEFSSDTIVLYLPNKRSISLKKSDIVGVFSYESPLLYAKWLGVFRVWPTFFCITSWNNLVQITLRDGTAYVISPRIIATWLFDYYSA